MDIPEEVNQIVDEPVKEKHPPENDATQNGQHAVKELLLALEKNAYENRGDKTQKEGDQLAKNESPHRSRIGSGVHFRKIFKLWHSPREHLSLRRSRIIRENFWLGVSGEQIQSVQGSIAFVVRNFRSN